jgi:sulfur carrier protein ThiS
LAGKYKGLASPNVIDHIVILVNGKVCKKDKAVDDEDQISMLTPLVGG